MAALFGHVASHAAAPETGSGLFQHEQGWVKQSYPPSHPGFSQTCRFQLVLDWCFDITSGWPMGILTQDSQLDVMHQGQ